VTDFVFRKDSRRFFHYLEPLYSLRGIGTKPVETNGEVEQCSDGVASRHMEKIVERMQAPAVRNVFDAYNVATNYVTHQMRSYQTAFDLLNRINAGFQKTFPVARKALPEPSGELVCEAET
jgi:hypothetical protein